MNEFLIILQTTAPVFLITFLGIFLKKWGIIDDDFVHKATQLIYKVALPVLIFIKLSSFDAGQSFDLKMILYIIISTVFAYLIIWWIATPSISNPKNRCAFVHGAFRSNYAIVGFALIANIFGEDALGGAVLILSVVNPLYNFLAIILLTITLRSTNEIVWGKMLFQMLKNPLIIAFLVALPIMLLQIPLPYFFSRSSSYLASMTLPLALLCIGGSLNLSTVLKASKLAIIASGIKLILIPGLCTYGAILLGYRGSNLGIMVLLFAAPSAVASFILSQSMGANGKLAGNIVVISTLGGTITITLGIYLLRFWGYL